MPNDAPKTRIQWDTRIPIVQVCALFLSVAALIYEGGRIIEEFRSELVEQSKDITSNKKTASIHAERFAHRGAANEIAKFNEFVETQKILMAEERRRDDEFKAIMRAILFQLQPGNSGERP